MRDVDVFISYKQEQRSQMRPIAEGLRALGVAVWFDEQLRPDRSFTDEITEVIKACQAQLVCWSPAAVASDWVRGEAELGRRRGVLIAAMIEPCDLPPPFNMLHAEDLSGWTGDANHPGWRKIVDAIGMKLNRQGLGRLAALQGSNDSAAWAAWAQSYPADPQAGVARARAENLAADAARDSHRSENASVLGEGAHPARRSAVSNAILEPARDAPAPSLRNKRALLGAGAGLAVLALSATIYVIVRSGSPAPSQMAAPRLETTAATVASTAAKAPAVPANPNRALAAIDGINANEWAATDGITALENLVQRVVGAASRASLDAAARSDARAQFLVGAGYWLEISGYAFNKAEALRLFRSAADRGFAPAQYRLAAMYAPGGDLERDDTEAARLFRLAADQGFPAAQYALGNAYRDGRGVAQSFAEAAVFYRLAADQGYSPGQYALGVAYQQGQGVAASRAEAVRLYRLAAQQGDAYAQGALRRLGETW